jgi:Uma2 family endonuclease
MTIRVDRRTAHEPDALVYCGQELPDFAIEVPNPMIVVEVLSPTTQHIDASAKLAGYFRISSARHHLIVDGDDRLVIHHARAEGDNIATRINRSGGLRLDPPGIDLRVEEFFQVS